MYSYTNDISRSLSSTIVRTHDGNMDHQHANIIQDILRVVWPHPWYNSIFAGASDSSDLARAAARFSLAQE